MKDVTNNKYETALSGSYASTELKWTNWTQFWVKWSKVMEIIEITQT